MNIYDVILKKKKRNEKIIAALIDPDSENLKYLKDKVNSLNESDVNFIFVGGSTTWTNDFSGFVRRVSEYSSKPVIIFPGSSSQVSEHADAILFLSLVSGNNPQYLIGEHVKAAPMLKNMDLEVIPTGYLLIDGGKMTTVQFMSDTRPIPQDKPEIAKNVAYAAELMGMKLIYLDSGSGALKSVSNDIVEAVSQYINLPLMVGGGLKNRQEINEKFASGADLVVVGSALEDEPELLLKKT